MKYLSNISIFILFIFTSIVFSANFIDTGKGDAYRNFWKNPELEKIILESEIPEQLDSLSELDGNVAKFEMGRLCFSLGLYRQAQQYFEMADDTELKFLFLAQINMILSEYDLALVYLEKIPDTSFAGYPMLCKKQISSLKPDLTENLDINDDFSKFYSYFVKQESSLDDFSYEDGSFTIQFGAFSDESRAKVLEEKVSKEGLNTRIAQKSKDGQILYLVHGGSFKTKDQAEKKAEQLSGAFIYNIVEIQ
ncbi:MAG: SPOR domain-containing protein [Candidatus Zixiibacteriota bacterium]